MDAIVRVWVPFDVRIENVDNATQAEDIARDYAEYIDPSVKPDRSFFDGSRERGRSLEDVLYDAADPTSFYPADDRVEFHYEVIIESDHNSDIDP